MKILHIAPDEKFIDSAIWQFESVYPDSNRFLVLLPTNREIPIHVKNRTAAEPRKRSKALISEVCRNQTKYRLICFHSVDYFMGDLLLALSSETMVLWIVFGYEVYDNGHITGATEFLGDRTKKYFRKIHPFAGLRNALLPLRRFIKQENPNLTWKRSLKRADYCGILFEEEFQSIMKKIDGKSRYFKFSYYPIEFILKDKAPLKGNDILLGNSATLTNNHLDILAKLEGLPMGQRKLIVPLNYGDEKYGKEVVDQGNRIFPDSFEALLDFLSLEDYNRHVSSCSIVIMGHKRQQAVGTVLAMLYRGARVYLDKTNTLFKYLKRIGAAVYSVQDDLTSENPYVFHRLTPESIQMNRNLLDAEIGQKVLLSNLKNQIENFKTKS